MALRPLLPLLDIAIHSLLIDQLGGCRRELKGKFEVRILAEGPVELIKMLNSSELSYQGLQQGQRHNQQSLLRSY
jgi:hypothetical protein